MCDIHEALIDQKNERIGSLKKLKNNKERFSEFKDLFSELYVDLLRLYNFEAYLTRRQYYSCVASNNMEYLLKDIKGIIDDINVNHYFVWDLIKKSKQKNPLQFKEIELICGKELICSTQN